MPNVIIANDTLQVTAVCRLGGQNGLMVWHYKAGSVIGATVTDGDCAAAVSTSLGPKLTAVLTAQANFQGVILQVIKPLPHPPVTEDADAGPGDVAGDAMSSQTSGEIALRTNLIGKSNRGRKYVPFPGESDNSAAARPTAGYLTRLATLSSVFTSNVLVVNGAGSLTLVPVVFSRKLGTSQFVADAKIRSDWATQRRRSQLNRGDQPIIV